jgi:sortase A
MKTLANVFAIVSLLALGYWAFVSFNTYRFQRRETRRFATERQSISETTSRPDAGSPKEPAKTVLGSDVALLVIPRLDLSTMVIEGAGEHELQLAPGHIPGTSLPGGGGNVGIAGHRDTFFRPLRKIRRDDTISIVTPRHEYRYKVISTEVVGPRDIQVLYPTPRETLTLVTCYPFDFVGAAPQRFIVRAECIDCSNSGVSGNRNSPNE